MSRFSTFALSKSFSFGCTPGEKGGLNFQQPNKTKYNPCLLNIVLKITCG